MDSFIQSVDRFHDICGRTRASDDVPQLLWIAHGVNRGDAAVRSWLEGQSLRSVVEMQQQSRPAVDTDGFELADLRQALAPAQPFTP